MKELKNYILTNFSIMFMSIFLPLYAIASVIFLIKLASYTAIIQLSIFEMFKLYLFVLPELLFYTLPITFFIAATLTLFRFSNDNEAIVFFALGIEPKFILKTLFKPALLLSSLLIFDFFIMFPHSTVMSSNFIYQKKGEAKFNLSASEFGHNFGDWLLFIGATDAKKSLYKDIFLFHKEQDQELLLSAKEAKVINKDGVLTLKLLQGEGYNYSDKKFNQIDYDELTINNTFNIEAKKYRKPLEYWLSKDRRDKKIKAFITDFLIAIFPLLSLYLVMAIGIVHTRHNKSGVYLYLFLSILLYYAATLGLQEILAFYTIPFVVGFYTLIGYIFYKKTVLKRF